jgi:hypothetical protein
VPQIVKFAAQLQTHVVNVAQLFSTWRIRAHVLKGLSQIASITKIRQSAQNVKRALQFWRESAHNAELPIAENAVRIETNVNNVSKDLPVLCPSLVDQMESVSLFVQMF